MSKTNVSVGIPVGPREGHRKWLDEALRSCAAQTLRPDEVILVVDGDDPLEVEDAHGLTIRIWRAPWRLGSASAFNHTVGLSRSEYVFLLGSDDTLEPKCLEVCMAKMQAAPVPERTVVWAAVRYMDTGLVQHLPCGAALVSRSLWKFIGGYPPEAAIGAPDFLLFSPMQGLQGREAGIRFVSASQEPLYNYRSHDETENRVRAGWWPIIEQVHAYLNENWKPAGAEVEA